ncbi:hypothetical protein EZV62_005456 [Acer yangbiense]|uniref:Uncharacterized protein n=1 Tax=Acer yangbiense TaxID=1000413 RepID=A0A5C7IMN4_9ROSI|nr:hypothetical protein EZV62_005456 [Acer yangbiense]
MYRSASWSRVSDDYFMHSSPKVGSGPRMSSSFSVDGSELPVADVEVGGKVADSVAARIEGLTIEGDIDTTVTVLTSALHVENVEVDMHKPRNTTKTSSNRS